MLNSLISSLLRALLDRIDPPVKKCPQQTVKFENLYKPAHNKCIEVIDHTDLPSQQNLDAIESELKELVDSLDLEGRLDFDVSAMPN